MGIETVEHGMAEPSSALTKPERVAALVCDDDFLGHCSNSKVSVSQRATPAIAPSVPATMKSTIIARLLAGECSTNREKSSNDFNARIPIPGDAHRVMVAGSDNADIQQIELGNQGGYERILYRIDAELTIPGAQ
jgi:hypothetical protein